MRAIIFLLRREALKEALMRKITMRNVLLFIGMSALVLVAATGPTLAKEPRARAHAETTKSAHVHARDWKRHHRIHAASRQPGKPQAHARVYNRGSYSRALTSYEADLLIDCLLDQPFVICP
jgi:hypothetical protein